MPISSPVSSDFSPHVGALFRFGTAELRLTEVEARSAGDGREAFTLVFAGDRTPVLAEGSYETRLPGGAAVTLYVIPIQTAARDRQDYQVVFN